MAPDYPDQGCRHEARLLEQTGLGRWTQGSAIQLPYNNRHGSIWEYAAAMRAVSVDFSWVAGWSCPICGGHGCIGELTPYERRVVELFPYWEERVEIARFRCHRTGRTFSLLPSELAPYHVYTVPSMLRVLALCHVLFGEPGKPLESILEKLPSDGPVTMYLIRCWTRLVVRGLRRAHAVLARSCDLRGVNSGSGFRGEVAEVHAYLDACGPRGPPWPGPGFLFGTPSQDRGR